MVPVVVLTGFLGSGKTSLLNQLMKVRASEYVDGDDRIAIIVNEFGAVGLDGDLLPPTMTRQVELPGGCICCVLNEDLDSTIEELLTANPDLAYVVIETTGIAEPLPITWTLTGDSLADRIRLAAVVTVVDAVAHANNTTLSHTVDAQVEHADVLVLSKLDLIDDDVPAKAAALSDQLRQKNPEAVILIEDRSNVAAALWRTLEDPPWPGHPHRAGDSAGDERIGQHGFQSVSFEISDMLDFEELSDALEELPPNYIRIKGIAHVVDGTTGDPRPRYVAFHRVGSRVSKEELPVARPGRLVAIGTHLKESVLRRCVQGAVLANV